ncbi:hypothetical protein LQK93_02365 [Terrabacter sp. BE26]
MTNRLAPTPRESPASLRDPFSNDRRPHTTLRKARSC